MRGAPARYRLRRDVVQPDRVARLQADLGDAGPHRAGAHDPHDQRPGRGRRRAGRDPHRSAKRGGRFSVKAAMPSA